MMVRKGQCIRDPGSTCVNRKGKKIWALGTLGLSIWLSLPNKAGRSLGILNPLQLSFSRHGTFRISLSGKLKKGRGLSTYG